MGIYLVILIYLLFLFIRYDMCLGSRYRSVNYWFACILLILVAALRYRIGFDTINYMESFESPFYPRLSDFSFSGDYGNDILWVFINAIGKSSPWGFYTVQFIQAAIVNIAVFWFIKRHSPKQFFAILLFFLFQWWNYCFEAMRESIAIAFYLFALDALICKNSLKHYYLRVWPAIFAHTFGFVTLFFPLIRYLKINKYLPVIFAAFLVVLFSISDLVNTLVEGMSIMENAASAKATKYIESDIYGESTLSIAGIIALILSRMVPIAYITFVLYRNKDPKTDVFIPYLLCYMFVILLRMEMPIFFRFYNYFEVMMIIGMTQAVSVRTKVGGYNVTALTWIMIIGMIVLRNYELTQPETDSVYDYKTYNRYIPYNSIFTEDYNEESEYIFRSK